MYHIVGVFIGEGPPVPIPNTEVKLTYADNTYLATGREDRSTPTQRETTVLRSSFFLFLNGRTVLRPSFFVSGGYIIYGRAGHPARRCYYSECRRGRVSRPATAPRTEEWILKIPRRLTPRDDGFGY